MIRYLQKIKDYMLVYRRSNNLDLVVYSDSNLAGCPDDFKSTSEYIFILVGGEYPEGVLIRP